MAYHSNMVRGDKKGGGREKLVEFITLVLEMGKSKGEYWLWLRYKTKIIEELCKWGLGKLRINIKEDDK